MKQVLPSNNARTQAINTYDETELLDSTTNRAYNWINRYNYQCSTISRKGKCSTRTSTNSLISRICKLLRRKKYRRTKSINLRMPFWWIWRCLRQLRSLHPPLASTNSSLWQCSHAASKTGHTCNIRTKFRTKLKCKRKVSNDFDWPGS